MEVDHVILAEERGRLSRQALTPNDLLPQERPDQVVQTVFHP
jgi:hypothetical protein